MLSKFSSDSFSFPFKQLNNIWIVFSELFYYNNQYNKKDLSEFLKPTL